MSLSKYLLIGLGVTAVGAGVLWLSREAEVTKFDPKIHTLEKLLDILEETYLEYGCGYIFYYNMILNLKSDGSMKPEMLESVKSKVSDFTKTRDTIVCKRFKITPEFFEQWIRKFKTDKKVVEIFNNINELYDQAIIQHNIKAIHFDIPEKLTRESYLQVAKKVQACVRHEAYNQVQNVLHKTKKDKVTSEEMDDILEVIMLT